MKQQRGMSTYSCRGPLVPGLNVTHLHAGKDRQRLDAVAV